MNEQIQNMDFNNAQTPTQQPQYQIGEEPISSDDLIFEIGEKTVDLFRKRKAITQLKEQLQVVLAKNRELNEYIQKINQEKDLNKKDLNEKIEPEKK